MAIPLPRVHLKVAHAALPALLPTPPRCKTLPLVPTPPCVAAIPPKPIAKSGRADSDERWDAHKAQPPPACRPAWSSASSERRSPMLATISSGSGGAARASSSEISEPRKNVRTSSSPPPLKPGRADSAERWDAHKKTAIPAASSSSGMSSVASSSKSPIRGASSAERCDVHKNRCPPQAEMLDDGKSSSTGSNDIDVEEEEILWKPRAMYAGPSFVVAAPQPGMVPMPTAFLVPVA